MTVRCGLTTHPTPKQRGELLWGLLDLDGTLAEPTWSPENPTSEIGQPIEANVAKAVALHEAGYKLVIHTSRPWHDYEAIEMWCDHYNIPARRIVCGKLLGAVMVDDRNVPVGSPDWTNPAGERELAWAAGFFDGEGSIFVNHLKRTRHKERTNPAVYPCTSPIASISQCDIRPLLRWQRAVGGRMPSGPYTPRTANSNPYWRWDANGRPSVCRTMTLIWPFLSEPKREQAYRTWDTLFYAIGKKSPALPPLPGWSPPS